MIGIIWATRKRKPVFLELRGAATPSRLIPRSGPPANFGTRIMYKKSCNINLTFNLLYSSDLFFFYDFFLLLFDLSKNIIVPIRLTE